jgi:hypothetical protein
MSKNLSIILLIGFLTACNGQSNSSTSSSNNSSLNSSSIVSNANSNSSQVVEEKFVSKINWKEIDDFKTNLYETSAILNNYKNNELTKEYVSNIMERSSYVIIPENPQKGFNLPYIIKFPDRNYEEVNKDYKNHLMLIMSNPDANNSYFNYAFFDHYQRFNNAYFRKISDEIFSPIVIPLFNRQCIINRQSEDQVLNTLLDRDVVLANPTNIIFYEKGDSCDPKANSGRLSEKEQFHLIDIEDQVKNIIIDAKQIINRFGFDLADKIFAFGYSGSANFNQRFSLIFPELIKAYFSGGSSLVSMPAASSNDISLIYPLGTHDFKQLFNKDFDLASYQKIAKFHLIGKYEDTFSPIDFAIRDDFVKLYVENLSKFSFANKDKNIDPIPVWNKMGNLFNKFEGQAMHVANLETGHFVDDQDIKAIRAFFQMNKNSEIPTYPNLKDISKYIVVYSDGSEIKDLNYADKLDNVKVTPAPSENELSLLNSNRNVIVSQFSNATSTGKDFDLIVNKLKLTQADKAYGGFEEIVEFKSAIVLMDSVVKRRIDLNVFGITKIEKNQVISKIHNDQRVVILYPGLDQEMQKMIDNIPIDIMSKDYDYIDTKLSPPTPDEEEENQEQEQNQQENQLILSNRNLVLSSKVTQSSGGSDFDALFSKFKLNNTDRGSGFSPEALEFKAVVILVDQAILSRVDLTLFGVSNLTSNTIISKIHNKQRVIIVYPNNPNRMIEMINNLPLDIFEKDYNLKQNYN